MSYINNIKNMKKRVLIYVILSIIILFFVIVFIIIKKYYSKVSVSEFKEVDRSLINREYIKPSSSIWQGSWENK